MNKKNTGDLQKELTSAPDLSIFLAKNQETFQDSSFAELLSELFRKSGLTKAALAKQAGTSDVYLYQIFSGGRMPSRDRTLCLCFGLAASLEDSQALLKHSGLAQLYARNRRDAIIIYGLSNGMTLYEVNEKLFEANEDTLC